MSRCICWDLQDSWLFTIYINKIPQVLSTFFRIWYLWYAYVHYFGWFVDINGRNYKKSAKQFKMCSLKILNSLNSAKIVCKLIELDFFAIILIILSTVKVNLIYRNQQLWIEFFFLNSLYCRMMRISMGALFFVGVSDRTVSYSQFLFLSQ